MTRSNWVRLVALGTLTGLRSTAGVATLAIAHRRARPMFALALAGEMVVDKMPWVGDRVAPLPLAGRALLGAAAGAVVAREQGGGVLLGGTIGAVTAIVASHLAFRARKALPVSNLAGGLLEDALVVALASRYA